MSDWTNITKTFDTINKPTMAVIVGIDVWDMAVAVYYTEHTKFEAFDTGPLEVKSFGEWSDYWNVLGHWHTNPTLTELKAALRTKKAVVRKCGI